MELGVHSTGIAEDIPQDRVFPRDDELTKAVKCKCKLLPTQ